MHVREYICTCSIYFSDISDFLCHTNFFMQFFILNYIVTLEARFYSKLSNYWASYVVFWK
jgi:hypothetical protein